MAGEEARKIGASMPTGCHPRPFQGAPLRVLARGATEETPYVRRRPIEETPYARRTTVRQRAAGAAPVYDGQRWLRNVCTSLILLKYLSLRNTDVTQLPNEINMLQQLEVLDIRHTPVNACATKLLMLLKLKRLLGGRHTDTGGGDASILSTVQMPHKVRMDLEVFSHVQASKHHATELREIGQLWQLRVLGVIIYDWKAQL